MPVFVKWRADKVSGRVPRHLIGGFLFGLFGVLGVLGAILMGSFGPDFFSSGLYVVIALCLGGLAGLVVGGLVGYSLHRFLPDQPSTPGDEHVVPSSSTSHSIIRFILVGLTHSTVVFLCFAWATGYFGRGDTWGIAYAALVGILSVSALTFVDGVKLASQTPSPTTI